MKSEAQQSFESRMARANAEKKHREAAPIGGQLSGLISQIPKPTPLPRFERKCASCETIIERMREISEGAICEACANAERARRQQAEERALWRRNSGVSPRHSKFQTTADLKGTAKYLYAVKIVRRFAFEGDAVLALVGARGRGKTQVLATLCHELIDAGKQARLIHVGELIGDLRDRYGGAADACTSWVNRWQFVPVLLIDEVGEFVGNDALPALSRLVNARYENQRPTIIAGNIPPSELYQAVGSSIADRCGESGGIVHFDGWDSFRTTTR